MDLKLAGLHAVVTGGSSGIGAAIVRVLAEEGCRVSFCARGQAGVDAAVARCSALPGRVQGRALDVSDAEQVQQWFSDLGAFDKDPATYQRVVARNPLGRLASPQKIARVVAFISSPAASFVAGANWYEDGGAVAHVQF